MRKKEKLTFWGIIIEGIKKFAGEIIGTFLLAFFLLCFPSFRALLFDYRLPIEHENIHQQGEEPKTVEVPEAKPETPKPAAKPKRPAISDEEFIELCRTVNVQEVEEAIMNGANVNAKDDNGKTVLMRAAMKGYTETARILLKHGADVNAKDNMGWTALIEAADGGHTEVTEVLLQHGANVNAKSDLGFTALMMAASRGYTKVAEVLLKHGAEVNARDNYGETALMKATKNNRTKTADLLRAYGAK